MSDLIRPDDLRKLAADLEMAKARKETDALHKREEETKALREAFMSREIHPETIERLNAVIRRAAANGLTEIEAFTFPAGFTSGGGRRINNNEPDWPDSLEGFAKKAYDYFEKELRPLGYKLQARVLSYPGGMIGDIGMYMHW